MMNNFKHENKCYTVAVVHPKDGPVVLDLPLMTIEKAEAAAKLLNTKYPQHVAKVGISCVAYNTTAVEMRPPYMVDMEQEWNYVLDHANESLYTELNTHSGGTI